MEEHYTIHPKFVSTNIASSSYSTYYQDLNKPNSLAPSQQHQQQSDDVSKQNMIKELFEQTNLKLLTATNNCENYGTLRQNCDMRRNNFYLPSKNEHSPLLTKSDNYHHSNSTLSTIPSVEKRCKKFTPKTDICFGVYILLCCLYLIGGSFVFIQLEADNELDMRHQFRETRLQFLQKYPNVAGEILIVIETF